ncbi:MAG: thermonuclease family protein [Gaiella sp.]
MSRRLPAAALAALLLLAAAGCTRPADDAGGEIPNGGARAVVEWVIDGDSLRLTDGREVRLVQIDAPEVSSDCFERDAARTLIELAKGERVWLERDQALDDVDTYGRLLRYVFVDGSNVNLALVANGAAAPYFFRGQRGRYAGALLAAAREARARDAGLWGACPLARLEPGRGSVTGPASTQRR